MMNRLFLAHPRSVNESYVEHAAVALRVGGTMVAAGVACVIHGLVPALFTRTGSTTIRRLHARLGTRQTAAGLAPGEWQLTYEI